ncbi:BcsE family c-di-GMP-binding protein [Shigella flexneri]
MQPKRVSARQQLSVQQQNGIWTLVQSEEVEIERRSDEKRILSNVAVLEGAPPLSEHWQLFNNNEVLFNEACTAQAATVVFSLQQNAKIELRPVAFIPCVASAERDENPRARKIPLSLRATDERLLLACGANMVIPWNAPLSRCLR